MGYDHRQRAPLFLFILVPGLAGVGVGLVPGPWDTARAVLLVTGSVMVALSFCFVWLRVRDEGDVLAARFGPIPLFRTRIAVARIRAVRRERSRLLDGWGIHWAPDRGWIWNLWGRDCIAIEMDRGRIRIGTDDPAGLEGHLRARLGGDDR